MEFKRTVLQCVDILSKAAWRMDAELSPFLAINAAIDILQASNVDEWRFRIDMCLSVLSRSWRSSGTRQSQDIPSECAFDSSREILKSSLLVLASKPI